jgi:transcriptional regulator GlxA family with amidase domain
MKQLSPVPAIPEFARVAGLNETKLKRSFKALFEDTPFDFSARCRMQHGLSLLRDQRIPVVQVAAASGYCHPTSFATAFGSHFALHPSDVQKNAGYNSPNS